MKVESRESRVESRKATGRALSVRPPRTTPAPHPSLLAPRSALRACAGSRPSTLDPRLARLAISLTEVLIAMGVLAVGLLGVASVFPVGSWYMQKATIADNGSALAQAVMNDIVARGTVNPKAWLAIVPRPNSGKTAHDPMPSDGKYAVPVPPVLGGTFTRPFADTLREGLQKPAALNNPVLISRQFGDAFVIDPLYIAAAATPRLSALPADNNVVAYGFPAGAATGFPKSGWAYYTAGAWDPWRAPSGPNPERVWPIRRVTLPDSNGWPLGKDMASYYFRGSDDLTTDTPTRADRPAWQSWDVAGTDLDGNNLPDALARQRAGDYSWIVSVAPTTPDARNGLVSNPAGYTYDVSVVVFYKRVLPSEPAAMIPNNPGVTAASAYERTVRASIVSTGLNGGELLLETAPHDTPDRTVFEHLRKGNWIMLCGPHPNSNVVMSTPPNPPIGQPRFVMKWYQVMSIETDRDYPNRRMVSVRGPEWPWLPTLPTNGYEHTNTELSNQLCVGICRGAVAVHTKTIRLESEYGSGMALK